MRRFPSLARSAGRTLVASLIAIGLVADRPRAADQDTASVEDLTAAMLLAFAKFTEWPAETLGPDAPILLCSTDQGVADALAEIANKKVVVGTRKVSSSKVPLDQTVRQCSVLHAAKLDQRRTATLVASLKGTSVLSVGDSDQFTKNGGIMHIFEAGDRLKFVVNVAAAERARLHFSSRLLSLAAQVIKE